MSAAGHRYVVSLGRHLRDRYELCRRPDLQDYIQDGRVGIALPQPYRHWLYRDKDKLNGCTVVGRDH